MHRQGRCFPFPPDRCPFHQGRQEVPCAPLLPAQPGPQGQHRLQNRQVSRSRNGEVPVEGGGIS